MLIVGETLPSFSVPALVDGGHGVELGELPSAALRGRWSALLYWPVDFGHACPELLTTVAQAATALPETTFVIATAGVPAERLVRDWRASVPRLGVPIAVDERGELARALGIAGAERQAARTTVVADRDARVRWVNVSDISPGRDLRQTLGVLHALRHDADPPARAAAQRDELLIAMCAWCRRVRDTEGWHSQEAYIRRRIGSEFTHGICHDCMGRFSTL